MSTSIIRLGPRTAVGAEIAGMRGSMSWFGYFDRRKWELAEELRAHVEMDVRDRMERGEPEALARAAATRDMGNAGLIRDVTQGFWRWGRLESWLRDGKYALRSLRRSPGFAAAVVGTLAVGIEIGRAHV